MSSSVTLFIGGARSGKSDLVVRLAERWPGSVTFVATATAGDDDMAERIQRHQADRPDRWGLVEDERFGALGFDSIDDTALVIVDCLTMLVTNQFLAHTDEDRIVSHATALVAAAQGRAGPTLIVTNEVGLGVHPETDLGRCFRDLLGRVNRAVAEYTDRTLLVVAGRALELDEIDLSW